MRKMFVIKKYLRIHDDKRGIFLMPNKVWHPEPVVAGGSDCKYINRRNAKPVGVTFCQKFGNPAHDGLTLQPDLKLAECTMWFGIPFSVYGKTPRIQRHTGPSSGRSLGSR